MLDRLLELPLAATDEAHLSPKEHLEVRHHLGIARRELVLVAIVGRLAECPLEVAHDGQSGGRVAGVQPDSVQVVGDVAVHLRDSRQYTQGAQTTQYTPDRPQSLSVSRWGTLSRDADRSGTATREGIHTLSRCCNAQKVRDR